jgi:ppGpp synthetase/RelA/SpoT-type nucleotidyltranferase
MTETPEGTSPDLIATLAAEYGDKRPLYRDYAKKCRDLIEELLRSEHIRVHSVDFREKDPEKLAAKLSRPGKQYRALEDVTDLAGIRIVTYMADEVDSVGAVIEGEFDVVPQHSIDKSQLLDPDRFGYLSLHYVCQLPDRRAALREYQGFAGLMCEIQVRSILQHAWAEIEHDLGYKSAEAIPRGIRRRFSRLAALLETADDEFIRIRDELAAYQTEITERVRDERQTVAIDKISLTALIQEDPLIRRIDERAAAEVGAYLRPPDGDSVELMVINLRHIGIETAAQLRQELAPLEDILVSEIRHFIDTMKPESVKEFPLYRGVSISHLWHVWLVSHGREELVAEHLAAQGFPDAAIDLVSKQIVGTTKLALNDHSGSH